MFPLHQSNDLQPQVSPNPHENHKFSTEDPTLGRDCASRSSKGTNENGSKKKKMKHREIERQRRKEMASLHSSLRSLLPLQYIKGKRSISDHVDEAARYIKHLQMKVKELEAERDEIKIKFSDPNASAGSAGVLGIPTPGRLTIQPCRGGVEIGIFASTAGDCKRVNAGILPLSRVLEVLLGQGLGIVSCVSTKVNGGLLHTIWSEASTRECINMLVLEQKLNQAIFQRP